MFKSEMHKIGFENLKPDYVDFQLMLNNKKGEVTRLLENIFIGFEEQCWDALLDCFEEGWIDSVQEDLDNSKYAGSIEAIFDVVEQHCKD